MATAMKSNAVKAFRSQVIFTFHVARRLKHAARGASARAAKSSSDLMTACVLWCFGSYM